MLGRIYQCSNGHSTCETCWNKIHQCSFCNTAKTNVRNFLIEDLAVSMEFPCLYETNGCTIKTKSTDVMEHKRKCVLRNYPCIFKLKSAACNWAVPRTQLMDHLTSHHNTVAINVQLNDEYIDTKTLFEVGNVMVIKAHDEIFFVHTQDDNNHACIICFYIGKSEDANKYTFEVSMQGTNKEKFISCIRCHDDLSTVTDVVNSKKYVSISHAFLTNFEDVTQEITANIRILH